MLEIEDYAFPFGLCFSRQIMLKIMQAYCTAKKFSSSKNFVKCDRQAVRQESIFVKRWVARFVFGRSVRLLIVYLHIHA